MRLWFLLAICVALLTVFGFFNANAQGGNCGEVSSVLEWLQRDYGESVDYTMSNDEGTKHIFITVNSETGSGTVLSVNGPVACILAGGANFTIHKGI